MTKRCICEICTCGRHRCPHRPNAPIGKGNHPCVLSEYKTTYLPHAIHPRESCRPPVAAVTSDGPIEDKTTHRVDYVPHPVERPHFKQADSYKRPAGDHDMMTSYLRDYTEKHSKPAQAVKRDGMRQVAGKFEGEPTYRNDYRRWDLGPRMAKYGNQPEWQPPQQKFEGESTFTRDFRHYNEPPRQSLRPVEAVKLHDTPFDDATGYRDAYIQHPLQDKFHKEKERYRPPGVPLDALSTFKRDYGYKHAPKTESCKPDAAAYQSQQPFDGMTTFKNDYRKWDAERPYVRDADQYIKPEGDMDMNTTHNLAYKGHPVQPITAKRPVSANLIRPGTFDATTNYATNYRKWDLGQRNRPAMKPDYNPNNAPFEGMSTHKAHYIPYPIQPSQSCKPDNTAFQSNAAFEDGTMYRMDYTPKQVGPCPAAIIDTGASRYKFIELDTRGHKMYRPVYETVQRFSGSRPQSQTKLAALSVA